MESKTIKQMNFEELVNTRWNPLLQYEMLGNLTFNEVESAIRQKVNATYDMSRNNNLESKYFGAYKLLRISLELIEQANEMLGVPEK
jgi:hypothetical protein